VNLYPILLDSRPSYLEGSRSSLLLVPLGTGTLLDHLRARLSAVSLNSLAVCPTFEPDPDSATRVQRVYPQARVIAGAQALDGYLARLEPSDWLFMVDPRCFPADGLAPESLLHHTSADPRWVRHLVALDASVTGTKEHVDVDREGRVRRIQRYYDAVTWPFASGVACSLLPCSCRLAGRELDLGSLADLRLSLAGRGVPSRDLPMPGGALDLSEERGLLALSERFILEATTGTGRGAQAAAPLFVGNHVVIHRSARIVGAVVLHEGVELEANTTILGPALLGAGVRVGPNAVVAQSMVAPGISVGADWVIRHRAVFADLPTSPPALRDPASASYRPTPGPGPVDTTEHIQRRSSYPKLKRAIDFTLALGGLVLLSPVLLLTAFLIRLDSRGAPLYGHLREGRGGRVFRCWKFRTMVQAAADLERQLKARSQVDGPQFKIERDPRVTRVGHILRRSNLDELPQLLNVLRGQMSFVGPRPSPFRENQLCVPWREGRLSVRPGITGLWQICRHDRDQGDFHQWIQYDLLYVRHQSLLVDLKILLSTVIAVAGRGHVPLEWIIPQRTLHQVGLEEPGPPIG
jgi:lipopolysaccharide/colanic/teichoic acid biosynthesis glycosyltransferase/carbonic anhydrase/acetyltransferase-like protein (isoleucine patch superfamily)